MIRLIAFFLSRRHSTVLLALMRDVASLAHCTVHRGIGWNGRKRKRYVQHAALHGTED